MIAKALIDHKTSTIDIQGVKMKLVPRYFDTPLKNHKNGQKWALIGLIIDDHKTSQKGSKSAYNLYVNCARLVVN